MKTRYPTHADPDRPENIKHSIRNAKSRTPKSLSLASAPLEILFLINSFAVVQRHQEWNKEVEVLKICLKQTPKHAIPVGSKELL